MLCHARRMHRLKRIMLGLLAVSMLTVAGVVVSVPLGWAFSPDKVAALTNVRVPGGGGVAGYGWRAAYRPALQTCRSCRF